MKFRPSHIIYILFVALFVSCSTKQNTAKTRFFHSFTTRYNVYYNANEAYKKGMEAKIQGNRDDYTERLPLFLVGNKNSQALGKSDFDMAVTKSEKAIKLHSIKRKPQMNNNRRRTPKEKEFLARKEYNPFLHNAWFLMGKAKFESGEFTEAASVFAYMLRLYPTQPVIRQAAAAWLARCYAQMDWYYDAEDVIDKIKRDTIPTRVRPVLNATLADLYLRTARFEEAVPYLQSVAKHTKKRVLKARTYFILGQVYYTLNRREEAYKSLQKCISLSPPFELAFNARILQAEVLGLKDSKRMLTKLRRMADSPNNEEYLDQVYYAIGNIYLLQADTASAIATYEQGEERSKRGGINKGVLMLRLGELYWARHNFEGAQRCYGQAVGLVGKEHAGYETAFSRSKVLDELVPHTTTISLQDSLQRLARMSEKERNEVIDRIIADLKKKEAAERLAARDSAAQARRDAGSDDFLPAQTPQSAVQPMQQGNKEWYFYNPLLVTQGKTAFKKLWGTRKNEDNWRRNNKTVVSSATADALPEDTADTAAADTVSQADAAEPVVKTDAEDPHKRDYYLAQIPLTEQQMEASDAELQNALYHAGIIEKDKLADFPLALATLTRLYTEYPAFDKLDDVYYQLFLLCMQHGRADEAEIYKQRLAAGYPDSKQTKEITAPDYLYLAQHGAAIEDSLYATAYDNFRNGRSAAVLKAASTSDTLFAEGVNRPKFMLLRALTYLREGERDAVLKELKALLAQFPQSDVSELAGMILKGVEEGRHFAAGGVDLGSMWERRQAQTAQTAAEANKKNELSAERNTPFVFILAFSPDSVQHDALLYQLARFNFSNFLVRNFAVQTLAENGIGQMRVAGFRSYDEAYAYAHMLFKERDVARLLTHAKAILVSERNLPLLGTLYSYADYEAFYNKTFAPLRINTQLHLDSEGGDVPQRFEENLPPEAAKEGLKTVPQTTETTSSDDAEEEDGWYDIE